MPNQIKALILDVDGVIVGDAGQANFPIPNSKILGRLKSIRRSGIPVVLCTSRPVYSVQKIIDKAGLNNIHIGLAGGTLVDPIDNIVLEKHPIDPKIAAEITKVYLDNEVYTEMYGIDNYYLQKDQSRKLTEQHTKILQAEPILVDSLLELVEKIDVYKILPVASNEDEQKQLDEMFQLFAKDLAIGWAVHPSIKLHKWGNITAKDISKRHAAHKISEFLDIGLDEMLGVGDGLADWQFIELCGYKAAMGNSDQRLIDLVNASPNSYVGKSIDEDGILDILDHYEL